jgi:hypothetical protein
MRGGGGNKQMKGVLQGQNLVKFTKSVPVRWYGHVERMQDQRMLKQTAAGTVEGIRKRGRMER